MQVGADPLHGTQPTHWILCFMQQSLQALAVTILEIFELHAATERNKFRVKYPPARPEEGACVKVEDVLNKP